MASSLELRSQIFSIHEYLMKFLTIINSQLKYWKTMGFNCCMYVWLSEHFRNARMQMVACYVTSFIDMISLNHYGINMIKELLQ